MRGSSQRKFKRHLTNEALNSKKNLVDLAGLRNQIISELDKINDNFEYYVKIGCGVKYIRTQKIIYK